MLKEIAIVTLTVSNLAQVEQAWQEHFDYRTVASGDISTELASHWQAPDMAGDPYRLLQPANDAPVYVRLIADQSVIAYRPMTSLGWNATEILVQSPDDVAAAMQDSVFEVIGKPRDLWAAPNAPRVMQALGAGNELLYLTSNQQAQAGLGLGDNMPPVERPFIMVVGGSSMTDFMDFYAGTLGLPVDPPQDFRITMISMANQLPMETTYPLAVVNLAPGYLIELDELPDSVGQRQQAENRLAPGIAVVSFTADQLAEDINWLTEPAELAEAPYHNRKVGLLKGPAGELIEVIVSE